MSFFQNYLPSGIHMKKSHFYVWFLGAKESEGLRGSEFVSPAVRQLTKEANRHSPNKLTVQISGKGVKIIQTLPTISKSGKVKMEVMKLMIPSHSLTYSMVGRPPNDDVVGCIMLIFNPETRCPIHVHAYRCDSPETAAIMNNALQVLINRPENQRRFAEVENRLILRGLLYTRYPKQIVRNHLNSDGGDSDEIDGDLQSRSALSGDSLDHYTLPMHSEIGHDSEDVANTTSDSGVSATGDRVTRLHKAVFQELKEKLHNKGPVLLPPKDYSDTLRKIGTLTAYKYEERRAKTKQVVGTLGSNEIFVQRDQQRRQFNNGDFSSRNYNNNNNNPYNQPQSTNDLTNAMKRRSCAYESYENPIRNDILTNSNGKFRFSISDLPKNHMNYLDSSLSPYCNRFRENSDRPPTATNIMPLRKFGDTIKPKNECITSPKLPQRNQCMKKLSRTDSVNWMVKPTKFKSMENLSSAAAAVSYDQDFDHEYRRREKECDDEKLKNGFHQNIWLLPKLVDPFGRKYDQRVKVDNFVDSPFQNDRQTPTSWYIGPCNGYMI